MKQHTPRVYSSIGLLITLTIITITPPDSRASPDITQVGPPSRSLAHNCFNRPASDELVPRGIREAIRDKYKKRYEAWKNEFLSTETGRSQWQKYTNSTTFLLTITVSDDQPHDARTERYEWTSAGTLSAATITLGRRIDEGYPSIESYPVIGSLAGTLKSASRRKILAASKIAHEFGHVNQAIASNEFQRQRQLIHSYVTLKLTKDHERYVRQLTDLAQQLGATPVRVWTDWECLAEANTLLYLRDKVSQSLVPLSLIQVIDRNIKRSTKSCAKCLAVE